jgi:hypothetical protein
LASVEALEQEFIFLQGLNEGAGLQRPLSFGRSKVFMGKTTSTTGANKAYVGETQTMGTLGAYQANP